MPLLTSCSLTYLISMETYYFVNKSDNFQMVPWEFQSYPPKSIFFNLLKVGLPIVLEEFQAKKLL